MEHQLAKQRIRALRRAARQELVSARNLVADGELIGQAALGAVDSLGPGAIVLAYESMPHEPATTRLRELLRDRGVSVRLPLMLPDKDLDWFTDGDPERQPLGQWAACEADIAFLPGLTVDAAGTRLGQGGGSYDRVLPRLNPQASRIVLLHPGERSDTLLPREDHDQPVDAVLTADGWWLVNDGGVDGSASSLYLSSE